jgi:hypothetical protein
LTDQEVTDSARKKKEKEEKKNRHKVSFIDKILPDTELNTLHLVISYKKYNSMNTFDPNSYEEGESSHCCTIF